MTKRRSIIFEWHEGNEHPLRIIRDPWEEGLPRTTLSLSQDEASQLADYLQTTQP